MTNDTRREERSAALRMIHETPWAILPASLRDLVMRCESAQLVDDDVIAAAEREAAARNSPRRSGAVAVIPIAGRITHKAGGGFMSWLLGGTSTEAVSAALRQALADPSVGTILFDVDSPGGSVYGVDELANEIYQARQSKRIVAMVNPMAASAAYYLASQADEVVLTPSGEVGSIGVFAMHVDESRALEAEGLTVTLISAGKYKVEGNPFEPLSDEAREYAQGQVDTYYRAFVSAVARGRGVSTAKVESDFGQGRMLLATPAKRAGMVDRVATLNDTIARLTGGGSSLPLTSSREESVASTTESVTATTDAGAGGCDLAFGVNDQIMRCRLEAGHAGGHAIEAIEPEPCGADMNGGVFTCSLPAGHDGLHVHVVETPARCGATDGAARCMADRGHEGGHVMAAAVPALTAEAELELARRRQSLRR